MNFLNHENFFSPRRVCVASFVILAMALAASIPAGRIWATLAEEGESTKSTRYAK